MASLKKFSIIGIFISILSIFAMSHNAGAIDFSVNLDNYNLNRNVDRHTIKLFWNTDSTTCTAVPYCIVYDSSSVSRVKLLKVANEYNYPSNSIVVWRILVSSQLQDGYQNNISLFGQKNFTTLNDNLIFLGYNQKSVSKETVLSDFVVDPENDYEVSVFSTYHNFTVYEYYFKVLTGGRYNIGFESSNYNTLTGDIFDLNAYDNSKVMIRGLSLQVWSSVESKDNKEVEEKTQEAVNDSQNAGSSSSSSAEQGGANLLSAITGFFNVITSAQPSNCRFNAPLNTYFGNERLNVDLCAVDLPSGIGALTSIIAIGILIPFAIHMFNKFISLFRSFQS